MLAETHAEEPNKFRCQKIYFFGVFVGVDVEITILFWDGVAMETRHFYETDGRKHNKLIRFFQKMYHH
jgi:hypothetical protein